MTANLVSTLYVAFELGQDKWLLGFSTQAAQKPRLRMVPARDLERVARRSPRRSCGSACRPTRQCVRATKPAAMPSGCTAPGRVGIDNVVVDSSSIETIVAASGSRPMRSMRRSSSICCAVITAGERKVWSVVNVPTVADEDRRQLHRGLKDLQRQQTECSNRIKGLLASLV